MSKKFGKFLLVTAAVASAAATVYYYLHKKDTCSVETEEETDCCDDQEECTCRTYVPLNREEEVPAAVEETPESTEEFFNEDTM